MKSVKTLILAGLLSLAAAPAYAHFMMVYTPEIAKSEAGDLDFRIVFTHPAEAGHTMDMGGVKEFYAMYQRGDNAPKKIDLLQTLKPITWKNPNLPARPLPRGCPAKKSAPWATTPL